MKRQNSGLQRVTLYRRGFAAQVLRTLHYKCALLCAAIIAGTAAQVHAQYTLTAGDKTLEIGVFTSAYYNHRFLKAGEDNRKNNRFTIRDLQLDVEARRGNRWEARLQADLADLSTAAGGVVIDAENPGLMSAYVVYKALPVHVQLGYDKLPYSANSMGAFSRSPFWSRSKLTNGNFFSRRDAGVTLSSSLWQQRINLYAGIYSGLGESIITQGDNDASGEPEYIGRIDVAYPARYRYREVDEVCSPIPVLRAGFNARYANKTQPGNEVLPEGAGGDYGLRIIDGRRLAWGGDVSIAWHGVSLQGEYHRLLLHPAKQTDALFTNTPEAFNAGVIHAGGYMGQLNYFCKKLKTILAVRYENVNYNDLSDGHAEWLSAAAVYQAAGFRSALKIQYYYPLTEDIASDPLKYHSQIRVGWQYNF